MDRKTSKAHRILGTDSLHPSGNGSSAWDKPQRPRRQSLRTPDSTSRQVNSGFNPFPLSEQSVPPQNLRVRASSPLLGHEYRSHSPAPPLPKPSKKVRETGSSSNLFSYFSSKESKSIPTHADSVSLQPKVRNALQADPQVTYTRNSPKESKRKLRPPRIDLSILFPKPRNTAPQNPLLSPQRMTNSPSPVSTVVSDYPSNHPQDRRGSASARKLQVGGPLPERSSAVQNEAPKPNGDRSDLLSIPESKDGEWSPRSFEPPLERTVGTSEIDLALDRYAGRRSLFSRSSVYTASREQLRPDQNRPAETIAQRRAHSPQKLYLSPNAQPGTRRSRTNSNTYSTKTTLTKKSSRSTLKDKDLQHTSVLCLTSSEDEDSEQETTPTEQRSNKNPRDSIATYGELEPEIYTAATAQTGTVTTPTLREFERVPSTSSRGSNRVSQSQSQSRARHTFMSATSRSSSTTRRTNQSRRSSQAPKSTEADLLDKFPQHRLRTPQELAEIKRRSRVITVTRQEQDLLEAMRQRKGKITPSIFNGNIGAESNRNSMVPDVPDLPDRASMVSGLSRDSFCGSDTSFLRLSAVLPPSHAQTDQGAIHMDKDGSPSRNSSSDTEQKTGNSLASPQFSMGYSESLPSPATSGASPLTPTLPIHRFSLPSPKPPPRGPPPAIPEDAKQHTRTRTDSSEAIMLNESGDPKHKHDLPLWSFDFDWNHDQANVATVH